MGYPIYDHAHTHMFHGIFFRTAQKFVFVSCHFFIRILAATVSLCKHGCVWKWDIYPLISGHFNISWGDHDDWFMDLVDVFPTFSQHFQTPPKHISWWCWWCLHFQDLAIHWPRLEKSKNLSTWRSPNLWPSIYAPGMICYHDVQKTHRVTDVWWFVHLTLYYDIFFLSMIADIPGYSMIFPPHGDQKTTRSSCLWCRCPCRPCRAAVRQSTGGRHAGWAIFWIGSRFQQE